MVQLHVVSQFLTPSLNTPVVFIATTLVMWLLTTTFPSLVTVSLQTVKNTGQFATLGVLTGVITDSLKFAVVSTTSPLSPIAHMQYQKTPGLKESDTLPLKLKKTRSSMIRLCTPSLSLSTPMSLRTSCPAQWTAAVCPSQSLRAVKDATQFLPGNSTSQRTSLLQSTGET